MLKVKLRMPKVKYYAVKVGREGPKIYSSWDECKENTGRYPGAVHKSFTSKGQAEEWLKEPTKRSPYSRILEALDSQDLLSMSRSSEQSTQLGVARQFDNYGRSDTNVHCQTPLSAPLNAMNSIPKPISKPWDIVLSSEQKNILTMVQQGKNVFFTGSAGTGKSVLLRAIIRTLKDNDCGPNELAITASTGIASVNIGGTTLHSWAGIGLGQEDATVLAGKLVRQKFKEQAKLRWKEVRTLVIDEISMIDGVLFDKLEFIGRYVRQNDKPFGGIQLVLSGDFCQLPPVPDRRKGEIIPSTFAFESTTWSRCVGRPITLTQVFRQRDQDFVNMLNAMRVGQLDERTINEFRKLSRPVTYHDGIEPTELYPTRHEVDTANRTRLIQLPDPQHTYKSLDIPGKNDKGEYISLEQMERLLDRLVATNELVLKVGAQVMLIKNLVQGHLVNGSLGQVVDFCTSKDAVLNNLEIAQVENKQETEKGSQPPRIPDGIITSDRVWPLVRFTNGHEMLCVPTEFTVNNAIGEVEARRDQVPLILAWALSVHKSQGQTLERVRVDLGRTFEKGQAYVALSRATNMETLQVLNFIPSKVMAHPRVLAWYQGVSQEESLDEDFDEEFDEMDTEEARAAWYAD